MYIFWDSTSKVLNLEIEFQGDEPRRESGEDLWELEGVRAEGPDGPVAEDAVRVVSQEVALSGVEVVRLDELHGEVGGEPRPHRPLAHEAVPEYEGNVFVGKG